MTNFVFNVVKNLNMRAMKFVVAVFSAVVVSVFFSTVAGAQNYDNLVIQSFNSDIEVHPSGMVLVTETIVYDFADVPSRGIFRYVPTVYGEGEDKKILSVELRSVKDADGNDYEYTTFYENGSFVVKIGDPDVFLTGVKVYELSYVIFPAVNFFGDTGELYFNAYPQFFDVPAKVVTASVEILAENDDVVPIDKAICFTGGFGVSEKNCTFTIGEGVVYFSNTEVLPAESGMTVAVAFPKSYLNPWSLLKVNSMPEGAKVVLPDDLTDTTPTSFYLPPGEHEVKVQSFGYKTHSEVVNLVDGNTVTLNVELRVNALRIFLTKILPILLVAAAVIVLFVLWYKRGRDASGRGVIVPRFEIPKDLSPAEIGVIFDQKVHLHDITAAIMQLAVKGVLAIEVVETKRLIGKKKVYSFVRTKTLTEARNLGLSNAEEDVFKAIFESGSLERAALDDSLGRRFYGSLDKIKKELYDGLVAKGFFTANPDQVRRDYRNWAWIILIVGALFSGSVAVFLESRLYLWVTPLVSLATFFVSFFMPRLTPAGADAKEQIEGLRMYLVSAEKDRLDKLNSPDSLLAEFQKFLPYAVALDVEEKWAKHFESVLTKVPNWVQGGSLTNIGQVMNALNKVNGATYKAMGYSPSAGPVGGWSGGGGSSSWSGGSGFSGGGFSGGGFGGGGGGRW